MGKGNVFHLVSVGTQVWVAAERALHIYDSEVRPGYLFVSYRLMPFPVWLSVSFAVFMYS
jgi:hypothetical protein